MNYKDCNVLCEIKRKEVPLISHVEIDEFTEMVQNNFDYDFKGDSLFYPYELPKEILNIDFQILAIVGASGSGKSTLLKEFEYYNKPLKEYNNKKAIVSNFKSPNDASVRLSAVGLNSMPVWCRPRNVLSIGEGFRADLALNIESERIFDEFTSTIDRNVAKSTCNSIQRYIRDNELSSVVFCSCHNDYIPFLKPDIVVDLDEQKVYDCRGKCLGETLLSMCTSQMTKTYGECLGSIII